MRKSTESMTGSRPRRRSGPGTVRPGLIVSMSFRLAIPRRVGLHQSPLPLRQPPAIVRYPRFASRGFFIERRTHSYLFVSALGPTPDPGNQMSIFWITFVIFMRYSSQLIAIKQETYTTRSKWKGCVKWRVRGGGRGYPQGQFSINKFAALENSSVEVHFFPLTSQSNM